MKRIGFPGLGLEFNINSTAITIFGLDIQWYGVILSLGIVLAFLLFYRNATKKELIDIDTVYNITLLIVPISIVGARFVYVATKWDYYKNKTFLDMINLRAGGIAIYGAIIFGLATVLIYNKIKKTSSLAMLDALAPAVMLGQIIGRWGNFVNAEAYGWSEGVEELPWRMELDRVVIDGVLTDYKFVHPTFLYESLWNFIGLAIIIFVLYRKKKFDGEIFCAYTAWYGLGRAFIENLRADSLYLFGNLKFSVFVGIVAFIGGILLAIILYRRNKKENEELIDYTPAFESVKLKLGNDGDALKQPDMNIVANEIEPEDEFEGVDDEDEEVLAEQDALDGDNENEENEGE